MSVTTRNSPELEQFKQQRQQVLPEEVLWERTLIYWTLEHLSNVLNLVKCITLFIMGFIWF